MPSPIIQRIKQQVKLLSNHLKNCKLQIATAESCTGGGLSYWLTYFPGSSEWFNCGFITYHNEAKVRNLGVNPHTLQTFGAVSKETAFEMAEGIVKHSPADFGVAITGIAGPSGGSANKPVGTIWVGLAKKTSSTSTHLALFSGNRQSIRLQAIEFALEKLNQLFEKN